MRLGYSANAGADGRHIVTDAEKLRKSMQRITNYILGYAGATKKAVAPWQSREFAQSGIQFELSWRAQEQIPMSQGQYRIT